MLIIFLEIMLLHPLNPYLEHIAKRKKYLIKVYIT